MEKISKLFFWFSFFYLFVFFYPLKTTAQSLVWPTPGNITITSCFGPRIFEGQPNDHHGIDIRVPNGSDVVAVADGEVVKAARSGWNDGYGCFVKIKHTININGQNTEIFTLYAHLSSIEVAVGDHITAGQRIGKSGGVPGTACAGASTGAHLHFEIRIVVDGNEVWVDPLFFLPKVWNTVSGLSCTPNQYPGSPNLQDIIQEGVPVGFDNFAGAGPLVRCEPPQFSFENPSIAGGSCDSTIDTSATGVGKVIWTAYKAQKLENSDCGGKILVGSCEAPCNVNCTCSSSMWSCEEVTLEKCDFSNATCTITNTIQCQAWQVPTASSRLYCNDSTCEIAPWQTWIWGSSGVQEKTFYHPPTTPNAFNQWQTCPLKCRCWGKCLPKVEKDHYYDGKEEVDFTKEGSYCTPGRCRHKLPIKLGWDMPNDRLIYPFEQYWANDQNSPPWENVWSLKIKFQKEGAIGPLERFLTHWELLNKTPFKNRFDQQETKWKKLERLFAQGGCSGNEELYRFLRIWDPCLKRSRYNKYCGNPQGKDQLLYFIHFNEGKDVVGKPGGFPESESDVNNPSYNFASKHVFNYIPSADKRIGGPCTLASNSTYTWTVKLCCGTNPDNCGPPDSHNFKFYTDKTPEPIDIVGVKINKWKIDRMWNEVKKSYDIYRKLFDATVVSWIDVDWNNEAKAVNIGGDQDYVDFNWCPSEHQILRAFTQDYVEIIEKDLLKKEEEIATSGARECYCEYWRSQNATLADKIERGFLCSYTPYNPYHPRDAPDLQPDQPSLVYYPMKVCQGQMWGSQKLPRLQFAVNGKIVLTDVFLRGVQDYLKDNCHGMISHRAYGLRLAQQENINRETDDNPYHPFNIGGNLSWGWDVELALFTQKKTFSWQVGDGKDFGQEWQFTLTNWPPKVWQFSPYGENGGQMAVVKPMNRVRFYPENSELNFATTVPPHPVINYHRNIVFESLPRINGSEKLMIYAKDDKFGAPDTRVGGNEVNWGAGGTPRLISIPKKYAITTKRTGTLPGENVGGFRVNELPISGIWHCLSNYQNDYKRLGEVFEFHVQPCLDAWGTDCYPEFGTITNTVITGWPPFLGYPTSTPGTPATWIERPPPPQSFNCQEKKGEEKKFRVLAADTPNTDGGGLSRVRIPHKLNWAPIPGAASYEYEILDPEGHYIGGYVSGLESEVTPNLTKEGVYIWRVRTCADTKCLNLTWEQCQQKPEKERPECGEWPREGITHIGLSFYGCLLPPPSPIFPSPNQLFINDRPNQFSWSPVTCPTNGGENVGYYQIQIKFLGKEDCHAYCQKQNKEDCQNDEKNNSCTLKEGEIVLQPTLTSETFYDFADFPCRYGSYIWQIRSCLDSECKEAGEWSVPYKFTITREDPKVCWYNFWQRGGSGGGFGKCHIITCNPCYIHHFPVLLVNIMQCFLWTLGPIALVFLVLYSGLRLYFSAGALEVLDHLKAVWKFAGIGWLIMLLSWWILNFLGRLLHLPGW